MLLAGRDKSKNPRQCLRVELTRKQTVMYYQVGRSARLALLWSTRLRSMRRGMLRHAAAWRNTRVAVP